MNLRSWSGILLCTLVLVTSCSQSPVFREYETVLKLGDQPEWAVKDWNDQGWEKYIALVPDGRVFWSRTKIDILKAPNHFVLMVFDPMSMESMKFFGMGF